MEKKSALITCSMIAGALLSVSAVKANTNNLLSYNGLGTAGEVRTSLVKTIELTCGEKKGDAAKADTKTKDAKCGEHKAKDGKCGEHKAKDGKCGEHKAKDAKCGEKKAKDGKCGEGKCGEKKKTETPK
ncbi:MAG: hypothetical protein Q7W45_13085 [Bacteroidota bacterium]|nr:hypothetical protein [Bacteroidota bacterium]MDP3146737.1 hypothetical protein [Bacteroidota bacterium]MDP3557164.1 hypothetical protein [Bacteroidota bacterium]